MRRSIVLRTASFSVAFAIVFALCVHVIIPRLERLFILFMVVVFFFNYVGEEIRGAGTSTRSRNSPSGASRGS